MGPSAEPSVAPLYKVLKLNWVPKALVVTLCQNLTQHGLKRTLGHYPGFPGLSSGGAVQDRRGFHLAEGCG